MTLEVTAQPRLPQKSPRKVELKDSLYLEHESHFLSLALFSGVEHGGSSDKLLADSGSSVSNLVRNAGVATEVTISDFTWRFFHAERAKLGGI